MDFAWDPDKAASNLQKHNVSFEEAQSVFDDPLAANFQDEEHSDFVLVECMRGGKSPCSDGSIKTPPAKPALK
jgi:hypothetical protein